MIIMVSKDFRPLARALQKLYNESVIELFDHPNWLRDLIADNKGKYPARLTIIGHGDSIYGGDESYFGGNQHEKIMLLEEFSHLLITLLKFNERQKPGFCQHLKKIDIIDCHNSERAFIAQSIAEQLQRDPYLREHGMHITINGFANLRHPHAGSILMPHARESNTLSFYTFDSTKAYLQYKEVHDELNEQKKTLHHLVQMPRNADREETIAELQKQYDATQKKERTLLKTHTHKALHITDPRQYFDKHTECQIALANATATPKKTQHASHPSQSMFAKKVPANHQTISTIPHHRHTSYLEGSMFKQDPDENIPQPHRHTQTNSHKN